MNGSIYFVTFRSRQGELAPSERDVVLSAFKFWHLKRYWLTVIVVMLDHGHAVLKPLRMAAGGDFPFAKIMQGLKGFTSRQINERRGRRGQFWQAESYDRIVRDEAEFIEKWNYVRVNPVRSNLAGRPEEWPWLWEPGYPPDPDKLPLAVPAAQAGKPVLP